MARRNRSYSDFEDLRTFGGKDCGLLASIVEAVSRSASRRKLESTDSENAEEIRHLLTTDICRNARTAPSTPDLEQSRDLDHHTSSSPQLEESRNSHGREMPSNSRCAAMTSLQPKSPPKARLKSRSRKFHKVFKNISPEEEVIKSCSCAYFGDILLQGYLYISPNWFCFYTKILGHQKIIQIPVSKVLNIMRQRTAFIIPNAIGIVTSQDKYVFGSLLSRDSTFKLMCSIWQKKYLEVEPEQKSIDIIIGESDTNAEFSLPESSNEGSQKAQTPPVIKVTSDTTLESSDTEDTNYSLGSTDVNQSTCDIFFETSSMLVASTPRIPSSDAETPLKLSPLKCFSCGRLQELVTKLVSQVQSVPRTKLFLAVCSILLLFLFMCSAILSYKIVLLQARIESNLDWVEPSAQHLTQNSCGLYNDMYVLSKQQHASTVAKLHSVLDANIHSLHNIHSSLNFLQQTNNIKYTSYEPSASHLSDTKEIAS